MVVATVEAVEVLLQFAVVELILMAGGGGGKIWSVWEMTWCVKFGAFCCCRFENIIDVLQYGCRPIITKWNVVNIRANILK